MDRSRRTLFPMFCIAALVTCTARAGVLYSNLQGNYAAQVTSSYTVDKGGYSSATGYSSDFDFGFKGVGDDYSVDPTAPTTIVGGVASVQLTGLSFYGTVTPAAGNPSGSQGVKVTAYFFPAGSAGGTPSAAINFTPATYGTPGLQSITLSTPANVPANGYIIFSPYLASSYNVSTGTQTPLSNGEVTITAEFGSAPTVGSGNPAAFELSDTNRNLSAVAAQSGSPAYMDIELDGITASPEPSTFTLTLLAGGVLICRRRRA